MSSSATLRKPLGVRATPEEHKRITKAAKRANSSVNSFVLQAALQAAEAKPVARPRRTPEEIKAILDGFRAAVQSVVPKNRDILAEFLADRLAEAERE